eukprot:TRINITY_DN94177_c0_g1_i1.p4 TRINITY_DN94177_c0_g1~~TRINITY_DN94177_c0_g1_i1.p4  ORF type:complete len:150 (-),score=38.43 TRINITY_DN94177_c0_g1_i1:126-575(-)
MEAMTERKDAAAKLERLLNSLVDDITAATDEEIGAEAEQSAGGLVSLAARADQAINAAIAASGARRLNDAKRMAVGLAEPPNETSCTIKTLPFTEKKRLFDRFIGSNDVQRTKLTMAARRGEELTEEELDGILDDLDKLGVYLDGNGRS